MLTVHFSYFSDNFLYYYQRLLGLHTSSFLIYPNKALFSEPESINPLTKCIYFAGLVQ